jgi:hypothetical protein
MFARVLGPFFVIVCITAVAHTSQMPKLIAAFGANPLWSWVAGSFVLIAGLIMVALHSYWRTPAGITVSTLGWLVVLRGVLLLAFPTAFLSMANSVISVGGLWQAVCIVFAALGLYLSYVGWMPAPRPSSAHPASATRDLPRAA